LGSLPFIGASGALTQDNNNLFYDDANNRLGIGTNAPTTPLDVFGSGIISRINGTSTNNGFLGFASAGSNKWSVGNVQSDHRFRIFSEANTSELVSLLQTGEFGIGIANPTTKLHLDGGASALIANLDANVSVAKSLSFRSDNSNRINLEVSGTESGSNVGADFFIRRYSDAGALIDTPLTITRSTGLITLATALSGTSATFSGDLTIDTNTLYVDSTNNKVGIGTTSPNGKLTIDTPDNNIMLSFLAANNSRLSIGTTAAAQAYIRSQNSVSLRLGVDTSDYLNILSTGLIGIGTTSPTSLLEVKQPTLAIGSIFQAWAPGVSGANFSVISTTGQPYMQYDFPNGNVVIGNLGTGTVQATAGVLSVISDSKAKDKTGLFEGSALTAISKIEKPQYWNYNEKSNLGERTYGVKQFGLFADDIHEILGEEFAPTQTKSVYDQETKETRVEPILIDGSPSYNMSDRALLSLAIQAIQELKAEIDLLKGVDTNTTQ
jgi:hypothetical protein